MPLNPRVAVLLAFATAAGCSSPLAPHSSSTTAPGVDRQALAGSASHLAPVQLKIVGTTVTVDSDLEPRIHRNQAFYVGVSAPGVTDTVPAFSVIEKIQWWKPGAAGGGAYQDLEPSSIVCYPFAPCPPPVGQPLPPGRYRFAVQAPERLGGGSVIVDLASNFKPDTWWAGPSPDLWPRSSDGDGRAVDVADWSRFSTVPAWPPDGRGYFGPDSFRYLPVKRRPPGENLERRTFYEIYGDRIYARSEGDTVHLNSWIVLINGGYDKDSPYTPRVNPADPGLPPDFASQPALYPLLESQGLVGSPIGFRMNLIVKLTSGQQVNVPRSGLYPIFDPFSVFRLPQVAGYLRAIFAGKAYAMAVSEDGDGQTDDVPGAFNELADRVDAGGGTPEERLARRKILTFYIRPAVPPRVDGPSGRC